MLILYRSVNESIMIGDDIEIMVTEIRQRDPEKGHDQRVYLGFRAPQDIKIYRSEVLARIRRGEEWRDG